MPASPRREFLRAALAGLLLLAAWAYPARAETIQLVNAELLPKSEFVQLEGYFDIQLSPTLEDALKRGVSLTFVQEVETSRDRDYWFSEGLDSYNRSVRMSYNALLRQYHVSVAGATSTHDGLGDALRTAGDLRSWQVLNLRAMQHKSTYRVRLRMYLDVSQLPKPIQVNALASSSRWQLDSGWLERSLKY
jgi:hypothetical protein